MPSVSRAITFNLVIETPRAAERDGVGKERPKSAKPVRIVETASFPNLALTKLQKVRPYSRSMLVRSATQSKSARAFGEITDGRRPASGLEGRTVSGLSHL